MANLTESAAWEEGVFQLETTTPAQGGAGGPMNAQAQALANRTAYLKQQVEARLPLAGGTMTGLTELPGDGALPLHIASRRYASQARFANRLINPHYLIDQRGNAAGGVVPNTEAARYPVDRWYAQRKGGSTLTVSRAYDAARGHAFLRCAVSNPLALTASDYLIPFGQIIEGHNIADLGWGGAAAKPAVLSFPFRASIPGTYAVVLRNGDGSRTYTTTFAYSTANTWQDVEIPVPGNTSGTWLRDNGAGLFVLVGLVSGGGLAASLNSWLGAGQGHASATNWHMIDGATLDLGPAQFERGLTKTEPEFRHISDELALCQRYLFRLNGPFGAWSLMITGIGHTYTARCCFPVTMRASPTAMGLVYTNGICVLDFGVFEISSDGFTLYGRASAPFTSFSTVTMADGLFSSELV